MFAHAEHEELIAVNWFGVNLYLVSAVVAIALAGVAVALFTGWLLAWGAAVAGVVGSAGYLIVAASPDPIPGSPALVPAYTVAATLIGLIAVAAVASRVLGRNGLFEDRIGLVPWWIRLGFLIACWAVAVVVASMESDLVADPGHPLLYARVPGLWTVQLLDESIAIAFLTGAVALFNSRFALVVLFASLAWFCLAVCAFDLLWRDAGIVALILQVDCTLLGVPLVVGWRLLRGLLRLVGVMKTAPMPAYS